MDITSSKEKSFFLSIISFHLCFCVLFDVFLFSTFFPGDELNSFSSEMDFSLSKGFDECTMHSIQGYWKTKMSLKTTKESIHIHIILTRPIYFRSKHIKYYTKIKRIYLNGPKAEKLGKPSLFSFHIEIL